MNRYTLSVLILISCFEFASAQAPDKFSYQAVVRDTQNQLIVNQPVGIQLSIVQGNPSGATVYQETYSIATNDNGLISVEIGLNPGLDTINWGDGPYFINTDFDPTGGTNYTVSGSTELLSVPYALYAKSSEHGFQHFVGELFGGGIIVAVWKEQGVEKGLIASLTDISPGNIWSDSLSLIGPPSQSMIDGQLNSNAINSQSMNSAATLCLNHNGGGFSDWYLPSQVELRHCFENLLILNKILGPTNGFQYEAYWSSTEESSTNALGLYFQDGTDTSEAKNSNLRVRAVRSF